MTAAGSAPAVSPWRLRRARAVHLLDKAPHAEEFLAFYIGLVEFQERVADAVLVDRWVPLVRVAEGSESVLAVERLPVDELVPRFDDFLGRVADVGTEVITAGAQALLVADDTHRAAVLCTALEEVPAVAATTGEEGLNGQEPPEAGAADFHTRAFLEPLVTTLAAAIAHPPPKQTRRRCFVCAALPQLSVLRDRPDARGARSLVCSLCATEWRFPRLTCPQCGETQADRLPVHTAESVAHVRIDACLTCRRYVKSVDLRQQGTAVPLVDDVATVELDLWAGDQGLTKIRTNVLGF